MNTILADFAALATVTDEMRKLRVCPECGGTKITKECPKKGCDCPESHWNDLAQSICCECGTRWMCPTCKGTGLNPNQTAWWEAVGEKHIDYNPLQQLIPKDTGIIFCECPYAYAPASTGMFGRYFKQIIHRPESDNRPWPEVLPFLIQREIFRPNKGMKEEPDKPLYIRKYDISFALATPETAPVFKSFDIQTLVEA